MPRLIIEDNSREGTPILDAYEAEEVASDYFDLCADHAGDIEGWEYFVDSATVPSWLGVSIDLPRNAPFVFAPIDHPPYDDYHYECLQCGARLTNDDN